MTQNNTLQFITAAQNAPRAPLPTDPDAAAAMLIAALNGQATVHGTETSWAALQAEINALEDGDARTIRRTLARHHAVLQALTAHLLRGVPTMKRVEHAATLAKAAIHAQQADMRTLIALASLEIKEVS